MSFRSMKQLKVNLYLSEKSGLSESPKHFVPPRKIRWWLWEVTKETDKDWAWLQCWVEVGRSLRLGFSFLSPSSGLVSPKLALPWCEEEDSGWDEPELVSYLLYSTGKFCISHQVKYYKQNNYVVRMTLQPCCFGCASFSAFFFFKTMICLFFAQLLLSFPVAISW